MFMKHKRCILSESMIQFHSLTLKMLLSRMSVIFLTLKADKCGRMWKCILEEKNDGGGLRLQF